jgi:hypothetical protein
MQQQLKFFRAELEKKKAGTKPDGDKAKPDGDKPKADGDKPKTEAKPDAKPEPAKS